jgi:pimeloyl-ACP methyl ester carboxylesterase
METTMTEVKHRIVETNGIRMHVAEQGAGPLVVLCHGFPESWYSWHHQFEALAEAGFHVVAPDMRGCDRQLPMGRDAGDTGTQSPQLCHLYP